MKKRDVVELIRYHAEHNEPGFKVAAYTVAKCFDEMENHELAHYVMALVTDPSLSFLNQDLMTLLIPLKT